MTKRELIDRIMQLNPTATPAFLAKFDEDDLAEYLTHLRWVVAPEPSEYVVEHARASTREPLFAPADVAAVGA